MSFLNFHFLLHTVLHHHDGSAGSTCTQHLAGLVHSIQIIASKLQDKALVYDDRVLMCLGRPAVAVSAKHKVDSLVSRLAFGRGVLVVVLDPVSAAEKMATSRASFSSI